MPMRSLTPWSARRLPGSDMMNQFEEFINEFDRNFWAEPAALPEEVDFTPAIDLEDRDNAFLVTIDLPGLKKSDIKVDINNNVLTVSGERLHEAQGEKKYSERNFGKFLRRFSLPADVDANKVEARFEDGVLEIRLPKSEGSRPHSIKIS